MFFWKPSEDDLSYRNVRELPAKKIKENCHSQMLTCTTRGKQLERNSLTFPPPLKTLNSRAYKYLWHKHEQIRSWRRKNTSDPETNTYPEKFLRKNEKFCKFSLPEKSKSLEKTLVSRRKHCPQKYSLLTTIQNSEKLLFPLQFKLPPHLAPMERKGGHSNYQKMTSKSKMPLRHSDDFYHKNLKTFIERNRN